MITSQGWRNTFNGTSSPGVLSSNLTYICFTAFATEYAGKNKVAEGFKVDLALLDQFQGFLFQRNVRPGIGEWLQDKEWIRSRLEQEIVTIALGVPQGDEVELRRDPVVRAAVNRLSPQ